MILGPLRPQSQGNDDLVAEFRQVWRGDKHGGKAAEEKKRGCGETQPSCNQKDRLNGTVSVSFYGLADLKGGH